MKSIQLNPELQKQLSEVSEEMAILDEAGQVVAYVIPPGHRQMLYSLINDKLDNAAPKIMDRELNKRALTEMREAMATEDHSVQNKP